MNLKNVAQRSRYAFELLLDRRLVLFLVVDAFVVINALFSALLGEGLDSLFVWVVLGPTLFLGIPILSATIALERRAGSLDLALSVPSTELYFLRRVVPVCLFFTLQSWFLIHAMRILEGGFTGWIEGLLAHPVIALVLHIRCLQTAFFTGAVVLFWSSRLQSSGAVMFSSVLTFLALFPWLLSSPVKIFLSASEGRIFGIPVSRIEVGWNIIVVAVATLIFYLYARERLRRPATMLS